MAENFNDPFAPNAGMLSDAMNSFGQAAPRQTVDRGGDDVLNAIDALGDRLDPILPSTGLTEDDMPEGIAPVPRTDLLSTPMGGQEGSPAEPTAFQQKKVNWADGGRREDAPKAYDVPAQDFLEVDYEFGRKEGATDREVRAANVFGRQFTSEELRGDEEGRKLLELMQARRTGEYNKGGTLANFVKGLGNWSKSDIPFYGWMSDIGTSVTEAIDMSKTIKKLQDGERVSPHEAIAVRRFMLQNELEGTRTMAYNVGALVRQAAPFAAEMAATSAIGAALGSFIPGVGTLVGGAAGGIVGGLKWLFRGGKVAAEAGTRMVVSKGTMAVAKGIASGLAKESATHSVVVNGASQLFRASERRMMVDAGKHLFGAEALRALRTEAATELGKGATHRAISELARKKLAQKIATSTQTGVSDIVAKTLLLEADKANAVSYGATEAMKKWAAGLLGDKTIVNATGKNLDKLAKEGFQKLVKEKGADVARKELKGFMEGFSKAMIKAADGTELGTAENIISTSMGNVLNGAVEKRYAETITKSVLTDAMKNFELRFGTHGYVKTVPRFIEFARQHAIRGLLQNEYSLIKGGAPTIAHAGFGSFHSSWDALSEGIGRSMIQAPIQAAAQLFVASPIYTATGAALGEDVVFKGQLGTQVQALMTGDREKMDDARHIAVGQMFAEYWSESAGRGLAPMVGGAIAGVARKSPAKLVAALNKGRDAMITPLSRATGNYLSNAVEAVFGFKDVKKMSLGRVSQMVEDYAKRMGIKAANKADIAKIVERKSLDGVSAQFSGELQSKGIRTAQDLVKKAIGLQEDMTKGRIARAYAGYFLMQKGFTPDRVIKAFRQMGKGGGIIEEMGEERFGDFIKGLMHVDDSASNASILSEERLKNMFGSWVDRDQLATEFLGFAFPGLVRGGTLRLQKWMGAGAMSQVANAAQTVSRITNAASTGRSPTVAAEGIDQESFEKIEKWNADRMAERDRVLGTAEGNKAKMSTKANELFTAFNPSETGMSYEGGIVGLENAIDANGGKSSDAAVQGALANLRTAQSQEDAQDKLASIAQDVVASSGSEADLEANLKLYGGEAMFGAAGVDAIRREWRKVDGHEFTAANPIEAELGSYNEIVRNGLGTLTFARKEPTSVNEWLDRLVAYVPFAGKNNSAVAEEQTRADGPNGGSVSLVGDSARKDLVDAMETLSLQYGRSQAMLEPRMSFGRRALTRIAGIPAALLTGDLSFAAANPAGWAMADVGVPLRLQQLVHQAYFEGMKHGFRKVEESISEDARQAIRDAIANGGNLAVALQQCDLDRATLEKMEEAGAEYRRELMDRAAQEYLSACGVMTIAQSDLSVPAYRIVEFRHRSEGLSESEVKERYADEIEAAKSEIVSGAMRIAADQNVAHYSNYTDAGRTSFSISVDAMRAIEHGTKEEVLAAVLTLPAFRGVHGVINISDNAEHLMETLASDAMANTVDATRIAAMDPGADGSNLTLDQLGEVMQAMRREQNNYDEAENRVAAARWIRQVQLMTEGSLSSYSDRDGGTRSASVRPTVRDGNKAWVSRVTNADGSVTETVHAGFADADAFVRGQGFDAEHKQVVVTSIREVVSTDATSMMYFMYGSNRAALREAYLREIGGEDAVDRDRQGMKPLTVEESDLPPYLRKTWDITDGTVNGTEWEYADAETAAAVFQEEKAKRSESFVKYEDAGEAVLAQLGVVRSSSVGIRAAGMAADTFIARADGGFNDNALILAPDFASNGDSESMLRASLKLAFNSSVNSMDWENPTRRAILADAYDAFMKAKDDVLENLRTTDVRRYNQLKEAMDRQFPRLTGRVTTDALSAMAAASIFFTSERGTLGLGNGYFGAPELAVVADAFRASDIFPVFVSAVDEMLGGTGLFTKEASSVNGLARYLDAFACEKDVLARARKSSLFTGEPNATAKRNPYLVGYRYGGGRFSVTKDAEGNPAVVASFTGDVRGEYIGAIAANCHEIANAVGAEDGVENFTTAQMYNRMKQAGMFGGETAAQSAAPAPEFVASGGDSIISEAGARVADRESVAQESPVITPEIAGRVAVALRSVFRAAGNRFDAGYAGSERFMLNRGIAPENVALILSKYKEIGATVDELPVEAQANGDEEATEAVEDGSASSAEVFNHERNLESFVNSKDAKTVSEIVKWFFKLEEGDVSALFDRVRRTLASGAIVGANDADTATLKDFAAKMNPSADPSKTMEALAKGGEFATAYGNRKDELTAYLDDVTAALVNAGALDYALVVATIRSLPHARRLKMLDMVAQLTPTAAKVLTRLEDGSFRISDVGSVRSYARSLGAFQSMYTSLLSSRTLRGRGDFAAKLQAVENLCKQLGRPDFIQPDAFKAIGLSEKDVSGLVSALRSAAGKLSKSPVKNAAGYNLYDVDQKDYDAVEAALKTKTPDIVATKKALDSIQAQVLAKMDALVPVSDILFGAGSDASALLRSREMVAMVRSDVEKALFVREGSDMTDEARRAATLKLFHLANCMAVAPFASPNARNTATPPISQFRRISGFVWQLLAEPVIGLRLRGVTDVDAARETLRDMAKLKMSTDCPLENGTTLAEMYPKYDSSKLHGVDGFAYYLSAYMSGMPRKSASMNGRAKNAIEGKKMRTVTTLPSQIPAFLRATNTGLFKDLKTPFGTALDVLKANNGRWADGSNPITAITGALDRGNLPIDKRFLAGIAQRNIILQFARYGEYKNLVVPLFKGDKSSMYAMQVPVDVAIGWMQQIAADVAKKGADEDTAVPLSKELRAAIVRFTARMKGAKLADIAVAPVDKSDRGADIEDILNMSDEDFAKASEGVKTMARRADFYDCVYGLLAAACGQDKIDAKRVAVMLSVGPIMPMYQDTDPAAGYYRTTMVGGETGGAMMGGWFIHGCAANAVAAMSDRGSAQAQKLHVYNLLDGVDFDKGQAHDYGIGTADDETTSLACVGWWRRQLRQNIVNAMVSAGVQLDKEVGLERPVFKDGMDLAEYDSAVAAYEANLAKYREFCSHSTFGLDDLETHKAGAFGSRAGIAFDGKNLKVAGIELMKDGKVANVPAWFTAKPDVKKHVSLKDMKTCPLAWALSAVAASTGKDLSESDAMNVECEWTRPDGTVFKGTLKDAKLLPEDAKLSFRIVKDELGKEQCVAMDFFTRQMVAQVVANNSSSSKAEDGHSFATNLTRDVEVDELLIQAFNGVDERKTGFVDAHAGFAMMAIAQLQTNRDRDVFKRALERDGELMQLLKDHPNDRDVRDRVYDKIKAIVSKQMIPNYHGNHGVMVASGLKFGPLEGKGDTRFNHLGHVERAPGMDDYTADCFRPAFVYTTREYDAIKAATGTGMSRSYASGCVNVDQAGFRYGMYADEAKLDALSQNEWVKKQLGSDKVSKEIKALEGAFGRRDAVRMATVRVIVRGIVGTPTTVNGEAARSYETDVPRREFMEAFGSYVEGYNQQRRDVRFEDLVLDDKADTFDYAAIECGKMARTGLDGKKHLYVGGSFFAAHRSPSGNIEAFSGLVRASAPVTFDPKTGEAGKESKYALDPVTTNSQGSDTDGDSAGIQVFDYTLEGSRFTVTKERLRQLTDRIAQLSRPSERAGRKYPARPSSAFVAQEVMNIARDFGWTETNDYGEECIAKEVFGLVNRMLFEAQVENYRTSPTRHQGYCDFDVRAAKDSGRAEDVVLGSELADYYEARGQRMYDTGFVGRAPVGTDAVFAEPVTQEGYDLMMADLGNDPRLLKAVPFHGKLTYVDVLNAAVDMFDKGGVDLNSALSAAKMSDAASDSADGRGVSVFRQSRFLRALAYGVSGDTGASAVVTPSRKDGYSPLIDLVSHFDGISNNLFDTLKKMFATRAGWTKDLLPVMMARVVRRATERGANVRLDNRFFATELVSFLLDVNDRKSPVARYRGFSDPVDGRKAVLDYIGGLRASVKQSNDAMYKSLGEALMQVKDAMTASDIVKMVYGRVFQIPVSDKDALVVAAADLRAGVTGKPRDKAEEDFLADALGSGSLLGTMDAYGDLSDFPKVSGYTYGKVRQKVRQAASETDVSGAGSAIRAQSAVSWMFLDWMNTIGENKEVVVAEVEAGLRGRHRDEIDNGEYAVLPTSELGANYDRMLHLYGAVALLDPGSRERFEKMMDLVAGEGKGTEAFLSNVAAAVKRESERFLANGEKGPVADLFRSLVVDGPSISLRANASNAEIENLRTGFDMLLHSSDKYAVNGTEFSGTVFAKLIMIHTASMQPFSATADYVSQTTVPSVFGDALIRRMERGRWAVENVPAVAELVNCPPVKIDVGRKFSAYDIRTRGGLVYDTLKEHPAEEPPVPDFIKSLVTYIDRPTVSVNDLGMREDDLVDEGAVPEIDPRIATVFTTAHRFPNMADAFRSVDAEGEYTGDSFGSLEEALNDSIENVYLKIAGGTDAEGNLVSGSRIEQYRAAQLGAVGGTSYLETDFGGRDSWMTRTAKRILRDAAARNPHVYEMLKRVPPTSVIGAENRSVEAAYNSVHNRVTHDPDFGPSVPAPEVTATEGGGNSRVDASTVLRSGYLRALETLYPEFDKVARDNMMRSVPKAIEVAFKKVFGDAVKVTHVKNDAGEDTNLLRIERSVGGKTVVTHIAFGESIRRNLSHTDMRTMQSVVAGLNAARAENGIPPLDANELMALPENERALFMDVISEKGRINGESQGMDWLMQGTDLGFAGAMSGLIRLDLNAGFTTLFHEYFHSMIECYRKMGFTTEADMAALTEAYHDADGRFNEEAAADAYASYITNVSNPRLNTLRLRDYGNVARSIQIRELFSRMRSMAEVLAEASVRGRTPDGIPVFARCTLYSNLTQDEIERLKTPASSDVKNVEDVILSRSAGDAKNHAVIPNVVTPAIEQAVSLAYERLKKVDAPVRNTLADLSRSLGDPSLPMPPAPEPSPVPAPRVPPRRPDATDVGRVQQFLSAAVNSFANHRGDYAELDEDLAELMAASATADLSGKSMAIQHAVRNVRRLIREVAAANGIETERIENGSVSLTQAGRDLFADATVNELALRLMANADYERKSGRRGYEGEAENAGADYAFARALERITRPDDPSDVKLHAYYNFAVKQAEKSRNAFLAAHRAALASAQEKEARGDTAGAAAMRKQAEELAGRAILVVELADKVARGVDLHCYFPRNLNTGNLHGLLFKVFSGGATVDPKQSADGIRRYAADSDRFRFSFSLQDPIVQAAYDYANMAFFTAEAAQSFADGRNFVEIAEGVGSTGQVGPGSTEETVAQVRENVRAGLGGIENVPEAPTPSFPTVEFDTGHNGAEWILSNPGSWLASDMQRDIGEVSLRAMMTDHSMQAATENAYALATTALQVFGADCYAGDRLRLMELVKSDLGRNERGDFAYTKDGKQFIRFSHTTGVFFGSVNFGAKRVGEAAKREDLQLCNFVLQAVRHAAAGDKCMATGIDVGYLGNKTDLQRIANLQNYAPEKVVARVLRGEHAENPEDRPSALDKVLYRIMLDVPRDVAGTKNHGGFTQTGDVVWGRTLLNDGGLYYRVVQAVSRGANAAAARGERTLDAKNSAIMDALRDAKVVRSGNNGRRSVVSVDIAGLKETWDGSNAKKFLNDGGRPKELLDFNYWTNEFARAAVKLNRTAAKSAYLRNGAGSTLTMAATPNFWFHGGSGAHMLDVQKYQSVLQAIQSTEVSPDAKLRKTYSALFSVLDSIGADMLHEKAFTDAGACTLSNAQLMYFADLMGVNKKSDASFTTESFIERIMRGDFAGGKEVAGVDIDKDSTRADVIIAINQLVNREVSDRLGGGLANSANLQDLVDLHEVNERLTRRLNDLIPGRILAVSDQKMFERTGQLGTAWTAPEALMQMCQELVAAERFRSCLAQMLTSVSFDGTPNYVVDPSQFAAEAHRMPDAYWGALAKQTIARSGWCKHLPAYDEGKSGVDNMKAVYRAIRDNNGGRYNKPMDVAKFGAYPLFDGIMCRKSDADSAGNTDDLTNAWGGEAECYMRQLLGLVKAPTSGSVMRQLERILAWSKLASVGFSAFFQIATAFESHTAATGFTQAFMSNLPGRTGAKLGRAIGAALGRTGGSGAFQADALSFKDIVENINSNDPFIVELREMCDLIGMPLDQSLDYATAHNESNPGLGQGGLVKQDIERVYRWAQRFNVKGAGHLKSFLNFCYQHPTDYTFNVVLNGVKMAVVAQTLRRLREECLAGNRPFDPVKELRKHAAYIGAEIGGIDPGRYAWAHPQMQRFLRLAMFSWQWTVGAWVAGSGEVVSDMLFGGHSTTRASRQHALIRWMRMLGVIKFGVPFFMQVFVKLLAKAMAAALPPPEDPEEEEDEKNVPWLMWNNESKVGSLCFDITPILKLAARIPGVRAVREHKFDKYDRVALGIAGAGVGAAVTRNPLGMAIGGILGNQLVPRVTAMIPAYTGGGRNTTGNRRYYMHFGKQSDEFFRYFDGFDGAVKQLLAKGSTGLQTASQMIFGHTLAVNDVTEDIGRLEAFVKMFMPFSLQGTLANADAGVLAAVGPIKMGESKRSTRLRIVARLNDIVEKSYANDPFAHKANRRKLNLMCTDILREAQANGINPETIFTSALGDVTHVQYLKLMGALPKDANGGKVEAADAAAAIRALTICNRKLKDIRRSMVQKYEDAGTNPKKNPYFLKALTDLIRMSQAAPYADPDYLEGRFEKWFQATGDENSVRATDMAAKGGENFGNFLATDQVPATLFGVPVITDNYKDTDLAFFEKFPEAGGFYDMGGGGGDENPQDPETPPDGDGGGPEGEPALPRADWMGGDTKAEDSAVANAEAAIAGVIPFIKEHEGFREKAYRDSVGKWTVGYGQTEIDGRPVREGDVITEEAASKFVEDRVRKNAAEITGSMKWTRAASSNALEALYDLAYNMGVGAVQEGKSPTLNRTGREAVGQAAVDEAIWAQVPTYVKAGGRKLKGLVNRRNDMIKRRKA